MVSPDRLGPGGFLPSSIWISRPIGCRSPRGLDLEERVGLYIKEEGLKRKRDKVERIDQVVRG